MYQPKHKKLRETKRIDAFSKKLDAFSKKLDEFSNRLDMLAERLKKPADRLKKSLVLAAAVFMVHQPAAFPVEAEQSFIPLQVAESRLSQISLDRALYSAEVSRSAERIDQQWEETNEILERDIRQAEEEKRKADEAAKKKAEEEARRAEEEARKKAEAEAKRWVSPLSSYHRVSSDFGMRTHPISGVHKLHNGLDISADHGTAVGSISSGEIVFAGWDGAYGQKVSVKHWDGTVTSYCHMSSISVDVGNTVQPGSQIGSVGSTGSSTGPHLHIEVHPNGGDPIDPRGWLQERGVSF